MFSSLKNICRKLTIAEEYLKIFLCYLQSLLVTTYYDFTKLSKQFNEHKRNRADIFSLIFKRDLLGRVVKETVVEKGPYPFELRAFILKK